MEIREIAVESVDVVPGRNPRLSFSNDYIEALGSSLLVDGQESPITVLRKEGRYELIHGENRLRAAIAKGIQVLEAKVYDSLSGTEIICKSLKPNLTQKPLGLLEVALKVKELKDVSGWSHDRVGRELGWSQRWATDRIRIAEKLSPQVRQAVSTSCLRFDQARLMTKLPIEEQDGALIEILRSRMTGKLTAVYVAQLLGTRQGAAVNPTRLLSGSRHLIEMLHVITDNCERNSTYFSPDNLRELESAYSLLIRLLGKLGAIVHRLGAQK